MFNSADVLAAGRTAVRLKGKSYRYGSDNASLYDTSVDLPDAPSQGVACYYQNPTRALDADVTPLCIVAWVFAILGLDIPEENSTVDAESIHQDRFSPKALAMLKFMQGWQDKNGRWSDAVEQAALAFQAFDEVGILYNKPTLENVAEVEMSDVVAFENPLDATLAGTWE